MEMFQLIFEEKEPMYGETKYKRTFSVKAKNHILALEIVKNSNKNLEDYNLISTERIKSIYDLELHECVNVEPIHNNGNLPQNGKGNYMRVPGGWIYRDHITFNSVFIPFNNEFMFDEL